MDTTALLPLVLVVLALTVSQGSAQRTINVPVGGNLVLELDPRPPRVERVVWRHGVNLLAELTFGDPTYYGMFAGHTKLEVSGRLTVSNIQLEEGGQYSVEVNDVTQDIHYNIMVYEVLTQPSIRVTPLTCGINPAENCTLVCELEPEPSIAVSYEWKLEGEVSQISGKELTINDATKATNFTCLAKNPVSEQASESINNPFLYELLTQPSIRVTPLTCGINPAENCTLVCELEPEPSTAVSYEWKLEGEVSQISGKELTINDATKATNFTCLAKNPVSEQASESTKNPFLYEVLTQPSIRVTPLTCGINPAESCTLVCELQPQPSTAVSYEWKLEGEVSKISGKVLTINDATKATNFTCLAKNPFSEQASVSTKNPFLREPTGSGLWLRLGLRLFVCCLFCSSGWFRVLF